MKNIRAVSGIVITSVVAPLVAFAQYGFSGGFQGPMIGAGAYPVPGMGIGGSYYGQTRGLQITSFQSVLGVVNTLLGYMQVGIFLVALFYFLLGAYSMVKGDVAGGSKKLMYAALGVAAAILAFSIIPLVCFVTQSSGPACFL